MIQRVRICLSLLLAVPAVSLFAASFWPTVFCEIVLPPGAPGQGRRQIDVSVYKGNFCLYTWEHSGIGRYPRPGFRRFAFVNQAPSRRAWERFESHDWVPGWYYEPRRMSAFFVRLGPTFALRIPLLLFALPALWLLLLRPWYQARRRHRMWRDGVCACCHYNLAHNTSGVCPECGSPIPAEYAADAQSPSTRVR